MKVLLTRPEGHNRSMSTVFKQQHIPYMITPLLEIKATSHIDNVQSLAALKRANIIIFISTNAIDYAFHSLASRLPTSAKYYAIGVATYSALKAKEIEAIQAPLDCQHSEGLLSLPSLQQLDDQNITIVRGVGGRETLAQQLRERGAIVDYWQVYQRVCPMIEPTIITGWQQQHIDTIVVTSGEILANLIKIVPSKLFAWLHACHIIVPGTRVYDRAISAGFTRVTNAKAASSDAILTALGLSA